MENVRENSVQFLRDFDMLNDLIVSHIGALKLDDSVTHGTTRKPAKPFSGWLMSLSVNFFALAQRFERPNGEKSFGLAFRTSGWYDLGTLVA